MNLGWCWATVILEKSHTAVILVHQFRVFFFVECFSQFFLGPGRYRQTRNDWSRKATKLWKYVESLTETNIEGTFGYQKKLQNPIEIVGFSYLGFMFFFFLSLCLLEDITRALTNPCWLMISSGVILIYRGLSWIMLFFTTGIIKGSWEAILPCYGQIEF
jgi:hypothetical protein